MTDLTDLTVTARDSSETPDQDAEPPGPGVPGPVHPDDPAEGPDDEHRMSR